MVERCVDIVYSQVFARLRKRTFTSIDEVNEAFLKKIDALNIKKYKGSSFNRRQLFEQNEQHLLKPLPYLYVGKRVNVLWDNHIVEVYFDYNRIAVHHRTSRQPDKYHTLPEHMPA